MANGRVITGYSKPYVALYSAEGTTVTYSSGMALARGVSVSLDIDTADANIFYADNVSAETDGQTFTGGTVTLTVDGLKDAARKLIMGLPTATSVSVSTDNVDVYVYDDNQSKPYVGIGFIVRVMEDGVTSWIPYVLTKATFSEEGLSAETQGESIDFQTTELSATLMRDDTTGHAWKKVAEAQDTEAKAEAVIHALLA